MSTNLGTVILARLEHAVVNQASREQLRGLDTQLVEYLRTHAPTPDWEQYPIGRDFFLQNFA